MLSGHPLGTKHNARPKVETGEQKNKASALVFLELNFNKVGNSKYRNQPVSTHLAPRGKTCSSIWLKQQKKGIRCIY